MIAEHQAALKENLTKATWEDRLFFSILCCDRLRVCCWAFAKIYKYQFPPLYEWIDALAAKIINGSSELAGAEDMLFVLDRDYPLSEEFTRSVCAQARYGIEAAQNVIQLHQRDDVAFAIGAATSVIGAVDNYEYFAWSQEPEGGEFIGDDDNWLLRAECNYQIQQSISVRQLDRVTSARLRIENRYHWIPPAVDEA